MNEEIIVESPNRRKPGIAIALFVVGLLIAASGIVVGFVALRDDSTTPTRLIEIAVAVLLTGAALTLDRLALAMESPRAAWQAVKKPDPLTHAGAARPDLSSSTTTPTTSADSSSPASSWGGWS